VSATTGEGARRRYLPAAGGAGDRRVLVIDNYDSFTFNLVQYLLELGAVVDVWRNDAIDVDGVWAQRATHLLLSPGPGRPADSGVCRDLVREVVVRGDLPTLGVCLGHQTLCEEHGATVRRADRIMHGKLSPILHDQSGLFAGLPSPIQATRYHSLIVEESTLPPDLVPVARTPEGELMAVRHARAPVFGVQFHPESILTERGHDLLANFLGVER
jgi:anthranilate synthase component 2